MSGIFRAYDIRGIYPSEMNEDIAYDIGRSFVTFLGCKKVIVGRDMRKSSDKIFDALTNGLTDQGADVVDIGLSSSPMLYFAAKDSPAAIMITASHNPGEYAGLKICRENAIPISGDTGIYDIEKLAVAGNFDDVDVKGKIMKKKVYDDFMKHNLGFAGDIKKLKVVIDPGNGMGGYTLGALLKKLPIEVIGMNMELDGSFPAHVPDPLKPKNVKDLQKRVLDEKADFGIAPDGDADRVMFIDEKGEYVSGDMITALISDVILKKYPGATVLYDLRSSKAVKEEIESAGGNAIMCRVGHSFIKQQMREEDAVFAGELSGHFYYKDNGYTESSGMTTVLLLNLLSETGKTVSELLAPLRRYFASGEINSKVEDKDGKMKELEKKYGGSAKDVSWLDGIRIELDGWWFNVRASNTEPLLRLNLEADTKEMMEEKRDEVLALIRA